MGAAGDITFGAIERHLEIDFSFDDPVDQTKKLVGYRLYKEGIRICATVDPAISRMTCAFSSVDGTFDFTLTAYYDDGTESLPSSAYSFVVSSTRSLDLTWEADSSAENQGGFRIYHNGVLLQEITDPSARQLTYTAEFSSADHTFSIAAVDGKGGEKLLPDTLTSREVHPPAAVLSSSTAAGNAPLTVKFDGSASTAGNPPLTKYSWVFGDGSQAAGANVSHTYTTAGTYYAQLTVEDSLGLTDSVSTPIVVGQPAGGNQKPTAVISAVSRGLTVTFDGSKSSDPDGSIAQYSWDFGDGATGSGVTAKHTYASSGTYTVSLHVTDDKGETATAAKDIVAGASLPMEVGEVVITHEWVRVPFETSFVDPVVIAGPPTTMNGGDPVTVRVRNIDPQGFDIRLQEWDYQDQKHAPERVNYIVLEKGVYTLGNGSQIEAGKFTGTTTFTQVALQQPYKVAPVILTQVATVNETDAVTGRLRRIKDNSFEFRMQEMEATVNDHIPETICYLAWEPGAGEVSGLLYEAGASAQEVDHNWAVLTFETTFPEKPAFLADMQTFFGSDTAAVRSKGLSTSGAQVRIQEEQSKDEEIEHVAEVVGYLVIGVAATAQP